MVVGRNLGLQSGRRMTNASPTTTNDNGLAFATKRWVWLGLSVKMNKLNEMLNYDDSVSGGSSFQTNREETIISKLKQTQQAR